MSDYPGSWRLRSIDELCLTVTSGATPSRSRSEYYFPATIPWIKTAELSDGNLSTFGERISEEGLANSAAKILPPGTVLMAMYGATVGKLGILRDAAACNQAACAMIADPQECDFRWLFYRLLNDRERIVSLATGAAQQNLSGKTIRGFLYMVPPAAEQRAIAAVLGAIDDKITANSDVVRVAGSLANATLDDLLRDALVIPLVEAARFINGKAFTKDATGSGRVVIRIAELNSGIGGSTVYNDIDVADDHVARPGDLLFAWSGSLTVQRWYRPEAIINQHIFKVIPRAGYPTWLVHQVLLRKLEEFRAIASSKATTMGHIQRHHLDEPVMIPSREGIERQHAVMDGLWHTALSAEQESLKLRELRDTMLPQLMSGKLRVKDAEKQVEEAV